MYILFLEKEIQEKNSPLFPTEFLGSVKLGMEVIPTENMDKNISCIRIFLHQIFKQFCFLLEIFLQEAEGNNSKHVLSKLITLFLIARS